MPIILRTGTKRVDEINRRVANVSVKVRTLAYFRAAQRITREPASQFGIVGAEMCQRKIGLRGEEHAGETKVCLHIACQLGSATIRIV